MKKAIYLFVALIVLLSSCTKRDDNGLLGGNWQLSSTVYFSVYTDLAQWRDTRDWSARYMSYFRHSGDSLVLTLTDGTPGMYKNDGSNDTPITSAAEIPAKFHVPANFGYRIQRLTSDSLILEAQGDVVRLRRY